MTGGPGWTRLLAAARRSLERSGGGLGGGVSLLSPTDGERKVVIGITGVHRSPGVARLSVRLSDVDDYLRSATGRGLAETLAADGGLRDRPAERSARGAGRDRLLAQAARGRHAGEPWYEEWAEALRKDGALTRMAGAGEELSPAVAVLDALPAEDLPMPVFAERILGDTKALTEGRTRWLVLRALSAWRGVSVPRTSEEERELWEWAGVVPDDLASQVLVLNLPASGGLLGSWLTEAAEAAIPLRVTLHQLRLAPLRVHGGRIFVTENPAVLRAAAKELGSGCPPLVCAEGTASAALHRLLAAAPDREVLWRNDFDWTGVRLTAAALSRYPNARPWRMSAEDYRRGGNGGVPLLGTPAPTPWDPALAEAMRGSGRAVMEERLLGELLADLAG